MTLWGTGTPLREFLHVDDLADASLLLLRSYDGAESVNVGCGEDLSIADLAAVVRRVVGFTGRDRLRPVQAGRHPAQAAEHQQAGLAGLEAQDRPGGRHPVHLRVVAGASRSERPVRPERVRADPTRRRPESSIRSALERVDL